MSPNTAEQTNRRLVLGPEAVQWIRSLPRQDSPLLLSALGALAALQSQGPSARWPTVRVLRTGTVYDIRELRPWDSGSPSFRSFRMEFVNHPWRRLMAVMTVEPLHTPAGIHPDPGSSSLAEHRFATHCEAVSGRPAESAGLASLDELTGPLALHERQLVQGIVASTLRAEHIAAAHGRGLSAQRIAAGITVSRMSAAMGRPVTEVQDLERGARELDQKTLRSYLKALQFLTTV